MIMSDSDEGHEWENVVDITHNVVNGMAGRGKAFESTLATVLKVDGEYETWLDIHVNRKKDSYYKTMEILDSWRDRYCPAATHTDLINALENNQKFNNCQMLITKLKEASNSITTKSPAVKLSMDIHRVVSTNLPSTPETPSTSLLKTTPQQTATIPANITSSPSNVSGQVQTNLEKNTLEIHYNKKILISISVVQILLGIIETIVPLTDAIHGCNDKRGIYLMAAGFGTVITSSFITCLLLHKCCGVCSNKLSKKLIVLIWLSQIALFTWETLVVFDPRNNGGCSPTLVGLVGTLAFVSIIIGWVTLFLAFFCLCVTSSLVTSNVKEANPNTGSCSA